MARQLIEAGLDVKILESDQARCEELSVALPKAEILCGDGTNEAFLRKCGIETTDAVAALTGIDEENVLIGMYIRKTSQKIKVITKVNRTSFQSIIDSMDLGGVFNPRNSASNLICRYVRAMQNSESSSQIETLYKLVGGKAEALEFRVSEGSKLCGVPLQELRLRENLLIGCIGRGGKIIIPSGQDTIEPGDSVIVVTCSAGLGKLEDIEQEGRAMNKRAIVYVLGAVLLIGAALMLPPLLVALIYHEVSGWYFLWVMLGAAVLGALALRLGGGKRAVMYAKEGLIAVALSWIVLSLVGALPFTLSGQIHYLDAVFEMISGFTTTGSSILPAVEELDKCMLFWRSFSHWIGGMGILVFMLAMSSGWTAARPSTCCGPRAPGRRSPRWCAGMADSSKILYGIYFGLTVLQILFYLAGGEPLLDSLCNAFGTAGTGGFAIRNDSFASYSAYTQTVTTVFMALFGVNFSIYFFLLRRKFDLAWKNTELRWYVSIILGSTLLITCNMKLYGGDFGYSLHHAAFAVSSVITTTGFGTENFDLWPEFSRVILVLLMIVGASAGSTGGGLKVSRVVILMRAAKAELRKILHPHTVKVITVDGKPVSGETVRAVSTYFILYVLIAAASVLLRLRRLRRLDHAHGRHGDVRPPSVPASVCAARRAISRSFLRSRR